MLNDHERKMLLDFIAKHADGDILIQTANRVTSNLEDTEALRTYIQNYKPKLHAGDYVGTKVTHTGIGAVESAKEREDDPPMEAAIDHPEDLGPAPKKLGSNGQAIHKLMLKRASHDFSVDGVVAELKMPKARVKPMMALLLERGMIKRTANTTYQVVL